MHLKNIRSPLIMMLLVVACVIATQSLTLAHDIIHLGHAHEQTELCEGLNFFAQNEVDISFQSNSLFCTDSQIEFVALPSHFFMGSLLLSQRPRAPPSFIS